MKGETESSMTGKKSSKKFLFLGLLAVLVIAVVSVVIAITVKKKESYRTLEIIECVGDGTVYRGEKEIAAYEDMKLRSGDTITVGENSYVRMKFDDDKYVYLEGHALIKLVADGTKKDSRTIVDIELGTMITEVQNKLSDKSVYEINSPNTTMAIRGTITVSKVEYDIPEITDSTGESVQIQKKDVFEYIVKKNKLGKYSESNTANKPGESAGTVQTPEEDLLEATLAKVEEVFNRGVKAAVSSFVQEGKVELTTYEKKVQEDGTAVLAAVKVPVEEGNGINTKVEEIIPAAVVSEIKADDNGKLTINRTETVEEFLQDVVESVIEVQQVETIEELKEVLTEKIVEAIEKVEELNLSINLNRGSISEVIQETQPAWNAMIAPEPTATMSPTEALVPTEVPSSTEAPVVTEVPTPTEAPVATEAPTPTEAPVATEAPSTTEVPVVTEAPLPTEVPVVTEAPTPTAVPVVTEAPTPTEVPVVTEAPTPTAVPSPTPTATPSPSPSPSSIPTATPTVTPSPSSIPTATPTVTPSPSSIPTATPTVTPSPSSIPTAMPTVTPSPSSIPTATPSPSPSPSPAPTAIPSPTEIPSTPGGGGTGGDAGGSTKPTATPKPTESPTPTPEETLELYGFTYKITTDEAGEEYAILNTYNPSATIVSIPESITVDSEEGSKVLPVTEVASDAFSSCIGLSSIQIERPVTGLADAINNVAVNKNQLTDLVVPVTVVGDVSDSILSGLKTLEIVPVSDYEFTPSLETESLFSLETCSVLTEIVVPADLLPFVPFAALDSNVTGVDLSVVPGCDGSVVVPENVDLYDATAIRTLCMEGVSLPTTGFVFPGVMLTFISRGVEEIPANALATNYYYPTETIILEDVKIIGDYAFSNLNELGVIEAPALESRSDTAFSQSNLVPLTKDEFSFKEENGTVSITEITYKPSADKPIANFSIPNMVDGRKITKIAEDSVITTEEYINYLYVSKEIEIVGSNGFSGSVFNWINMPGVRIIDSGAFSGCDRLTKVETKQLESVGEGAFSDCPSLRGIPATPSCFMYSNDGDGYVINNIADSEILYDAMEIPAYFFGVPVVGIAESAFAGLSSLKKIAINGNCKIGTAAFKNSDSLEYVWIDGRCEKIGAEAFFDCDNLRVVNGTSVGEIESNAFESCDGLETAKLYSAKTIGNSAFKDCVKLTEFAMYSTTTIGDYAFYNCSALNLVLGERVETIGTKALVGIANEQLFVPKNTVFASDVVVDNITLCTVSDAKILENDLYKCEILPGLGRLMAQNGREYRVYNNDVMEPVFRQVSTGDYGAKIKIMNDGVERFYYFLVQYSSLSAGANGFLSKTALEGSFMPEEWTQSLYSYSLSEDKFTTIYVKVVEPSGTTYYASEMMTCASLKPQKYSDGNYEYLLYQDAEKGDYAVVTKCLIGGEIPEYVDWYPVTEIGPSAFENCALENINAPFIKKIGAAAFRNSTGLKQAAFINATFVDSNAFYGCTALEEVNLPNVLSIGGNAFSGCTALKSVELNVIEEIGVSAFENCANLHFSIPDSVCVIETRALLGIANKVLYVPMGVSAETTSFSTDVKLVASSDARIATEETLRDRVEIYEGPRVRTESFGDILDMSVMENWAPATLMYEIQRMVLPYAEEYRYCFSTELYNYGSDIKGEWITLFAPDTGYASLMMEYFGGVDTYLYIALVNGDTITYLRSNAFIPYHTNPFKYEIEKTEEYQDGAVTITGYESSSFKNIITVPAYIEGLPVVAIAGGAFANVNATNIECEKGSKLDVICSGAFENCEAAFYTFSEVNEIQEDAFKNSAICSLYVDFVGTIRSAAFSGCSNLLEVIVYDEIIEIEIGAFESDNMLQYYPVATNDLKYTATDSGICITGLSTDFDSTITDIRIPEIVNGQVVREIGADAFAENSTLRRVQLPNYISVIGERAFNNCSALEYVGFGSIGHENIEIREGAFMNCSSLQISITNNVTSIGKDAFKGTSAEGCYIPVDTVVDAEAFDFGTTIKAVTGSYIACTFAAVSGSPYEVVVLDEEPVRVITDGFCQYDLPYTLEEVLEETNANVVQFFVDGIPQNVVMEWCIYHLMEGEYSLTEEMLQTVGWTEIIANNDYRHEFINSRAVFVFRISDREDGSVYYITTDIFRGDTVN